MKKFVFFGFVLFFFFSFISVVSALPPSQVCCGASTDCTFYGQCYSSGTYPINVDEAKSDGSPTGDTDKDYCLNNRWYDCGAVGSTTGCQSGYECNSNHDCVPKVTKPACEPSTSRLCVTFSGIYPPSNSYDSSSSYSCSSGQCYSCVSGVLNAAKTACVSACTPSSYTYSCGTDGNVYRTDNCGTKTLYDTCTSSEFCSSGSSSCVTKTCTDPDASDSDPFARKTTVTANNGNPGTDFCWDSGQIPGNPTNEGDYLREYSCTSSKVPTYTDKECTYGCSYGKCNPQPASCVDTDNSPTNYNTKGTVTTNAGVYGVDNCFDDRLEEFGCSSSTPVSRYYTCPYGCADGRCKPQALKADCSTCISNGECSSGYCKIPSDGSTGRCASEDKCTINSASCERSVGDDICSTTSVLKTCETHPVTYVADWVSTSCGSGKQCTGSLPSASCTNIPTVCTSPAFCVSSTDLDYFIDGPFHDVSPTGTSEPTCPNGGDACYVCNSGYTDCSSGLFHDCVNLAEDENNCGGCGTSCLSNQYCNSGRCTTIISPNDYCGGSNNPGTFCIVYRSSGYTGATQDESLPCQDNSKACYQCNAGLTWDVNELQCVDLQSDEDNCGTLDHKCASDEICEDGICKDVVNDPSNAHWAPNNNIALTIYEASFDRDNILVKLSVDNYGGNDNFRIYEKDSFSNDGPWYVNGIKSGSRWIGQWTITPDIIEECYSEYGDADKNENPIVCEFYFTIQGLTSNELKVTIQDTSNTCEDPECNDLDAYYGCPEQCSSGAVCGDETEESPEECDLGNNNGVVCTLPYSTNRQTCAWCSTGCLDRTAVNQYCGDGTCQSTYETYSSCSADCPQPPISCGNNVKEGTEECDLGNNNGDECSVSYNYNRQTCTYCSDACTTEVIVNSYCGDGYKDSTETCSNCPADAGTCPPDPTCSDDIQNQGETGVDCGGPCPECPVGETKYVKWTQSSHPYQNLNGERFTIQQDDLGTVSFRMVLMNPDSATASFIIYEDDIGIGKLGDDEINTITGSNMNGELVAVWTPSMADFEAGGEEDGESEFYFEITDNGDVLESGKLYLTLDSGGSISSCGNTICDIGETLTNCPQDCTEDPVDPCLGIGTCEDYDPNVCVADICDVAGAGTGETSGTPVCRLDSADECQTEIIHTSSSGFTLGYCQYLEHADTDDCADGFLSYSWDGAWQWASINAFADLDQCNVNCGEECINIDGAIRCNEGNPGSTCSSGSATIPCPAQIQLKFFNWGNLVAAALLVAIVYFFIRKKESGKKKKVTPRAYPEKSSKKISTKGKKKVVKKKVSRKKK